MQSNQQSVKFLNEDICYYTAGRGRCVVLLHGFLGSSKVWNNIIPQLSKSYKVIVIDLPGHGQSNCLGYAHSMELMADSVFSVLKKLRIKKCVMVGHSMGGYVALAFANKYLSYLQGLCLFHSSSYADSEEKKKDRNRAIKIVKRSPKTFIKPMIKNLFAKRNLSYLKSELQTATEIALATPPKGIIAALVGMRDRTSSEQLLQKLQIPIMMVIGKYDGVLLENTLFKQYETVANKHLLYLKYDGHFGMLENPNASANALRKFLHYCYKK